MLIMQTLHMTRRVQYSTGTPRLTPEPQPGGDEPMQVGRTSLTLEEREHRRRGNLCLYCGRAGHFVSHCPVKGKAQQ